MDSKSKTILGIATASAKLFDIFSEPKRVYTILLTGEVSSGKSSYLNSLIGGIVGNISIQRETFNPTLYIIISDGKEENIVTISKKLETIHENEDKRNNIKEHDITIQSHFDLLPLRHGFPNDITILDCPGLNDSDDNSQFEKVVDDYITTIDLIIYITEAQHAFDKSSEVKQFLNIKQKIETEKSNGHYVDLIVIVNKFDDFTDPDLKDIYSRIKDKIGLPNEQIFQYSSHKMLVHTIKENKLNLYIPGFMKREVRNILKNSDVVIDKSISFELNKSEDFILPYYYINYSDGIIVNSGDWGNSIGYIKDRMNSITTDIFNTLQTCFCKWEDDFRKFIINSLSYRYIREEIVKYYETMYKLHTTCKQNNIPDVKLFNIIIEQTIKFITPGLIKNKKQHMIHMLIILYQYVIKNNNIILKKFIIENIVRYRDYLGLLPHVCIFYYTLENGIGDHILFSKEYITYLFSKSEVYSELKTEHYNIVRKEWINLRTEKGWLVNYIIDNEYVPKQIKILLHLSVLPYTHLKSHISTFKYHKEFINAMNFLDKNLCAMIEHYINDKSNQITGPYGSYLIPPKEFPLHNNLFKLNSDPDVIEYMKNYEKLSDILNS
jgi:GTPase Era involved in 16S rRNA processing